MAAVCRAACSGPRATATDTRVRPSARSGFYRVETRVENAGGAGQVDVTFRLQNRTNGRIVTQAQSVELERHGHADVALEIAAPPGDYAVEARVEYPPR